MGIVKESRLHTILFSTRSLLIILVLFFFKNYIYLKQFLTILIIFLTLFCSNLISKYTKDKSDYLGAKVGNLPFWPEITKYKREQYKSIYSIAQFAITAWSFQPEFEIQLLAVCVIQITAFISTLTRKGFLGIKGWHKYYLSEYKLIHVANFYNIKAYIHLLIGIFLYLLRTKLI